MVKKLAIDWDDHELRYVVAQCSGRSVKVTDAKVITTNDRSPLELLEEEFGSSDFAETETLVAIGRGKAELRELQLPPVPDEELPEMVRFQALRSFATVGENAAVDYLVTKQLDTGVEVIAAAVVPQHLDSIRQSVAKAKLRLTRIGLRPLSAAALYLTRQANDGSGEVVLIDLLSDNAEIVIARDGNVVFVRTVRMPASEAARGKALAGELKRSLLACGVTSELQRVVLWGAAEMPPGERGLLEEAAGCEIQIINPFEMVDTNRRVDLPQQVGRLAPLVGLLLSDEAAPERLIDFLNPRKPEVKTVSPYRKLLITGLPIAACLLLAFVIYQRIAFLDDSIAKLQESNASMQSEVKLADESIAKTETVDTFLDGDVNWLNEIRRMALEMPPSDQMIIRGVSASANSRSGGGFLKIEGGAINPAVIDEFEKALRDEDHQVNGTGASEQKTQDAYRWEFNESIFVTGNSIRDQRYSSINELLLSSDTPVLDEESAEKAVSDEANEGIADGGDDDTNRTTQEAMNESDSNEESGEPVDESKQSVEDSEGEVRNNDEGTLEPSTESNSSKQGDGPAEEEGQEDEEPGGEPENSDEEPDGETENSDEEPGVEGESEEADASKGLEVASANNEEVQR